MSNKILVMAVLLITAIFISGCIFGNDNETVPQDSELPDGFTYLGTHETNVEINETYMAATEKVYRNDKGEDIYVQVFESDNPGGLLTGYKSKYKGANYDPFKDIWFNGHYAIQVKDYVTINGNQESRYSIVWTTEKSMIIVGLSKDEKDVLDMAIATGS